MESHLKECPRCASELAALRDVASALGNGVEPVPEGLWSAISRRLNLSEHEESTPPDLKVLPRTGMTDNAARSPGAAPRSRTGRRYLMVVTSVAAAAAAAAAVLGFSLVRTADENGRLQAQFGSNSSSVVAALETPGHTLVSLHGANHAELARIRALAERSGLPGLHCTAQADGRSHVPTLGHHRGASDLARPLGSGSQPGGLHRCRFGDPESAGCHGRAGGRVSPSHYDNVCVESHLGLTLESLQKRQAAGFSSERRP